MWQRLLLLLGVGYLRENMASSALTTSDMDSILYEHNELRKSVQPTAADMEYMVWNEKLAAIAQDWADQCVYTHNILREKLFKASVGENIYFTLEKYRAGEETKRWFEEGQKYSYTNNSCSDKKCGHYTQLVWAKSREIGCGVKKCDIVQGLGWRNSYVVVCDYSPRGNTAYQKPYTAGKPCSQCQDGNNTCYDSLCGNPTRPRKAEDMKTTEVASSILDLEAFNGEPLVMDQPEFDTKVPTPVITDFKDVVCSKKTRRKFCKKCKLSRGRHVCKRCRRSGRENGRSCRQCRHCQRCKHCRKLM
ncbi:GLIPR1-like protein 1 [Branchiostoma lanceolatum]|uniref:GLIPR1-like protein 1 n=1 Tax=Branchiostoma lanceolatum TaxID=7740 RepID=UPI0034567212